LISYSKKINRKENALKKTIGRGGKRLSFTAGNSKKKGGQKAT
jgi:hypothetical protein